MSSETETGKWCLIESDPGVFTDLLKGYGVKGAQVEELWSLDKENFDKLKPVYGLIFLFKWKPEILSDDNSSLVEAVDKIYFAKQVVDNACATQAILNILLNCRGDSIDLGETLNNFKNFSENFLPSLKGVCLTNCETIRNVHNSFSKHHIFEMDDKINDEKEDVFHFTCYLPFENHLYELDGLKNAPIDLGSLPEDGDWISKVKPIIEQRMKKYNESEIHFNLMAVVSDLKEKYKRELIKLESNLNDGTMETDDIQSEMSKLHMLIAEEDEKMQRYQIENIRRKHNYIPFIMEYLKILAKDGKLTQLYNKV
ncbi:unnamed protein product [Gordionus sp. m RMFG-2023]